MSVCYRWITPATCIYGLDKMVNDGSGEFGRLLHEYDVYMLPVNNPDGYVYTHTKASK